MIFRFLFLFFIYNYIFVQDYIWSFIFPTNSVSADTSSEPNGPTETLIDEHELEHENIEIGELQSLSSSSPTRPAPKSPTMKKSSSYSGEIVPKSGPTDSPQQHRKSVGAFTQNGPLHLPVAADSFGRSKGMQLDRKHSTSDKNLQLTAALDSDEQARKKLCNRLLKSAYRGNINEVRELLKRSAKANHRFVEKVKLD